MYTFSYLEPVCWSMSISNNCFLTCIQVSQEACKVVWYSHLFQNFPQFIVIHTVKGFGIVNKAEIDVFWNSLAFLMIQRMLAIWSLVPLPFLKPAWTSGSSRFTYCWSLAWRILSITLVACALSLLYHKPVVIYPSLKTKPNSKLLPASPICTPTRIFGPLCRVVSSFQFLSTCTPHHFTLWRMENTYTEGEKVVHPDHSFTHHLDSPILNISKCVLLLHIKI